MGQSVALMYNRIAGRGQAMRRAREFAEHLLAGGHLPVLIESGPGAPAVSLSDHPSLAALVVVGGDGSVRMASRLAAEHDLPLWQVPCGTENLFAREFGMTRNPADLNAALRAGRVERFDLGSIDGSGFTLMASVGYDASVVHRLAEQRRGAITHLSYIRPMLAELAQLSPPLVSVRVDGKTIIDAQPGMLVVANCKQYAMRLNPASNAAMNDGMLDVVFLPHRTRLGLAGWLIDTIRSKHLQRRRAIFRRGEHVEVVAHDQPLRFQVDGDALTDRVHAGGAGAGVDSAEIALGRSAFPVLLPAAERSRAAVPAGRARPTAAA
jgi:diacylglycerol kinase family enzyme